MLYYNQKCVIPHYIDFVDDAFNKYPENKIFEAHRELYKEFGNKMSAAVAGLCVADLYAVYGLVSLEGSARNIFKCIIPNDVQDTNISFLTATATTVAIVDANRPDNIVFSKGCLIVPRGEILWSLLAYDAAENFKINDDDDDDDDFKIYLTFSKKVTANDHRKKTPPFTLPYYKRKEEVGWGERKKLSHYSHLEIDTNLATEYAAQEAIAKSRYVYLNPNINNFIKSFKYIAPRQDHHQQSDRKYLLFASNLFFIQTITGLSLLSTHANRLLMYPPSNNERICMKRKNEMSITIPRSNDTVARLRSFSLFEKGTGYTNPECIISRNVVLFANVRPPPSSDADKPPQIAFNSEIVRVFEREKIKNIRETNNNDNRLLETTTTTDGLKELKEFFDIESYRYFNRILQNTYPNVLKFGKETTLATYTPNCMMTSIGLVATKNICQREFLIVQGNVFDLKAKYNYLKPVVRNNNN